MAKNKKQVDPKDPGWYPDPHSRRWSPTERFWDGSTWTGQTRLSGSIAAQTAKQLAGDAKARIEQEQLGDKAKQASASARAKIEEADLGSVAKEAAAGVKRGKLKPILIVIGLLILVVMGVSALGGGRTESEELANRVKLEYLKTAKDQGQNLGDLVVKDCQKTGSTTWSEQSGKEVDVYACAEGYPNDGDGFSRTCYPAPSSVPSSELIIEKEISC